MGCDNISVEKCEGNHYWLPFLFFSNPFFQLQCSFHNVVTDNSPIKVFFVIQCRITFSVYNIKRMPGFVYESRFYFHNYNVYLSYQYTPVCKDDICCVLLRDFVSFNFEEVQRKKWSHCRGRRNPPRFDRCEPEQFSWRCRDRSRCCPH